MGWLKTDLYQMLDYINAHSDMDYEFDIAYGGWKLCVAGGGHTVTFERMTKQKMGQFLSGLEEYLKTEEYKYGRKN